MARTVDDILSSSSSDHPFWIRSSLSPVAPVVATILRGESSVVMRSGSGQQVEEFTALAQGILC